jgi:hypothetical protein
MPVWVAENTLLSPEVTYFPSLKEKWSRHFPCGTCGKPPEKIIINDSDKSIVLNMLDSFRDKLTNYQFILFLGIK